MQNDTIEWQSASLFIRKIKEVSYPSGETATPVRPKSAVAAIPVDRVLDPVTNGPVRHETVYYHALVSCHPRPQW